MALTPEQVKEYRKKYGLEQKDVLDVPQEQALSSETRMERLRRIVEEGQKEKKDAVAPTEEAPKKNGLLRKGADIVSSGVGLFTEAAKSTGIPKVIGGAVGLGSGIIGGGVGGVLEVGRQISQGVVPGGKGFEARKIPETAIEIGKKTAKFGQFIGEEGAAGAPLGVAGRPIQFLIGGSQLVTGADNLVEGMKSDNSELLKQGTVDLGIGIAGILGGRKAEGVLITPEAKQGLKQVYNYIFKKRVIESPAKTADDVISAISDVQTKTPAELLKQAEIESPEISFKEKMAGVRPDIKKRIQGKPEKLKEYFDVVNTRNLDDEAPTAYGYGGRKVHEAEKSVTDILNAKGTPIGQFREKIATYKAPQESISVTKKGIQKKETSLIDDFDESIKGLNLIYDKKGNIVQQKGRVKLIGDKEVLILNDLRKNVLRRVEESPTVENLIDARIAFDKRINFAKRTGDVSDAIDPLSRKIRNKIAKINENIVGKEQSELYKDYSLLKEAQGELRSYTDRRAGAEYLIRLVLSGRGEEARELLSVIKKYTGKDLMDDAVMAKLSTELLGNTDQMNLFRQEIKNAGLDVAQILTGGKVGATMTLLKKGAEYLGRPEQKAKVFMEAARSAPKKK